MIWMIFLVVYGVDGVLTIVHRLMLRENIGEAHRKHAYQLMANELNMKHLMVSSIYAVLQLIISLVMVCIMPESQDAHWMYFGGIVVVLTVAYCLFMKKYYHLHENYLRGIGVNRKN